MRLPWPRRCAGKRCTLTATDTAKVAPDQRENALCRDRGRRGPAVVGIRIVAQPAWEWPRGNCGAKT